MTEHKTDINITKIEKYKKLNMTEHKTDVNIIKIDKYKKMTEQQFYDRARRRHEQYKIQKTDHDRTQSRHKYH